MTDTPDPAAVATALGFDTPPIPPLKADPISAVDDAIRACKSRDNVPAGEMVDLLLDIRTAVTDLRQRYDLFCAVAPMISSHLQALVAAKGAVPEQIAEALGRAWTAAATAQLTPEEYAEISAKLRHPGGAR